MPSIGEERPEINISHHILHRFYITEACTLHTPDKIKVDNEKVWLFFLNCKTNEKINTAPKRNEGDVRISIEWKTAISVDEGRGELECLLMM